MLDEAYLQCQPAVFNHTRLPARLPLVYCITSSALPAAQLWHIVRKLASLKALCC